MKVIFSLSISTVLLLCSCAGEAEKGVREETRGIVDPQFLISPGQGIGRFLIHERAGSDEERAWAEEHELELYEYIPCMSPCLIWWMEVSSSEFSTKEGLRVGSSAEEVLETLSNARIEVIEDWDAVEQDVIRGEGVIYYLENGKVERIGVGSVE